MSDNPCSRCADEYPDEYKICSQHAAIVEHDLTLSQALGKFGARLATVEANTNHIPKMVDDFEKLAVIVSNLTADKKKLLGFVGGVSATVSLLVIGAYYLINIAGSIAPWLKTLLPKGGN